MFRDGDRVVFNFMSGVHGPGEERLLGAIGTIRNRDWISNREENCYVTLDDPELDSRFGQPHIFMTRSFQLLSETLNPPEPLDDNEVREVWY